MKSNSEIQAYSELVTPEYKDSDLILSLKIKKFPTHLKTYEETTEEVIEHINFKTFFPKLFLFIKTFDSKFCSKYVNSQISQEPQNESNSLDDNLRKIIESDLTELEEEFSPFLIEEWNSLNVYMSGKTKIHTMICLIFLYYEIEILKKNFREYDKNVLYWAILLHDIAKHVILNEKLGEKFESKSRDSTHPFKSGAVALKIFFKNNLIIQETDNEDKSEINQKIERIYFLLINSAKLDSYSNSGVPKYIHSHENLQEILNGFFWIKQIHKENEWIVDVLFLIIFHQSLPNNKAHMNKTLLEERYVKQIFDLRLLELMRILMVNDSAGHSLFSGESFAEEINENLDNLRAIIK